jgi:DNA-binding transcriptional ArsR family regulator
VLLGRAEAIITGWGDSSKALADPSRLKLVGLLAQQSYTVEQLAAMLNLGVSTTSHHLTRLAKAGLVTAQADGYYNVYSLRTEVLSEMARRLLSKEDLPKLAQEVDRTSYDRKVLAAFSKPDGSFRAFPVQEKKFLVLLRHAAEAFEPGKKYTEKQVNQILFRFHEDTAQLRRGLVAYQLMARDTAVGGGKYWRLE